LAASREELLDSASTSILQAIAKTATRAAKKGALDVATVAELRDLASALDRARGKPQPQTEVNVGVAVAAGVTCTEEQRQRLIKLRQRLQGPLPINVKVIEKEATVPAALPSEMQPQNVQDEGNSSPESVAKRAATPPIGSLSPVFSIPAGMPAPPGASKTFKTWLEYEPEPQRAEPEDNGLGISAGL